VSIGDRAESHKEMPSSRWDHCEEHLHEWSLAMWLPRISVSCLRVNQVGCGSLIVLHLGRSTLSRWSSSKIPSNKQRVSLHLRGSPQQLFNPIDVVRFLIVVLTEAILLFPSASSNDGHGEVGSTEVGG